jgi:hypothetical protein
MVPASFDFADYGGFDAYVVRVNDAHHAAFNASEWLKQASRSPKEAAWNGQEICRRPKPASEGNVTSCFEAGNPHRHCECGEVIDLDHGYCDDCMAALLRGAAMTDQQSIDRRADRLKWLEKFGFIIPDLEALLRRGLNPEITRIVDE